MSGVVNFLVGAIHAIITTGIEVLGDVTVNAGLSIPKLVLRALTSAIHLDSATIATQTSLGRGIPEGSLRTGGAFLSIEMRVFCRAVYALLIFDVIDLVLGARLASLITEVKILRVETLHTLRPVKEVQRVFTLTLSLDRVELPTATA